MWNNECQVFILLGFSAQQSGKGGKDCDILQPWKCTTQFLLNTTFLGWTRSGQAHSVTLQRPTCRAHVPCTQTLHEWSQHQVNPALLALCRNSARNKQTVLSCSRFTFLSPLIQRHTLWGNLHTHTHRDTRFLNRHKLKRKAAHTSPAGISNILLLFPWGFRMALALILRPRTDFAGRSSQPKVMYATDSPSF